MLRDGSNVLDPCLFSSVWGLEGLALAVVASQEALDLLQRTRGG